NGTYSITGTLSTQGEGQNIFDLSTKSATISNDLVFEGSGVSGDGGNIINIGNDKSLTLADNSTAKTLTTNSGTSAINFNGTNATLSGNVETTNTATTIFNLG
ncbi:hypothetical protein CQA57_08130, partial [Helicobacter anseris]